MTEFENLPEHLIHYIMNFLTYKDATKCIVLSKAFKSLWLSSPVLEFDSRFFKQHEDPEHRFFSHILKTLWLRSPLTNNYLQKVRLSHRRKSPEVPFPYQPTFDMFVNFAIENTSKEIVFEIISVGFVNVRYEPLVQLFSSEFLTALNLTGLRIPIADPIIHCPKLKALKISRCEGLRTITVSSLCVEEVDIDACRSLDGLSRLDRVRVPKAKNLKNLFRFERGPGFHPCEFDLPACESVKSMSLYRVKVVKNKLTIPVTDTLYINYCPLPMNFRIQNPKLQELKIWDVCNLDNLCLVTPNLKSLYFGFGFAINPSQNRRLTMNISACVALTILELERVAITDEWVMSTLSNLGALKELKISDCISFRKLALKNDKLEILSLKRCYDLNEVIIDSPNLLKFDYDGSMQVYPMTILSTKVCPKIKLPPNDDIDPILRFDEINQFLSFFDHIQDITITSARAKGLIFPIDHVSESNPFPLRDLKYMKVETLWGMQYSEDVMEIIEVLLWLVPKPLELTLSVRDKIIIGTLKFEYGKEVKRMKAEERFGFGVRTRCWRDYELKIQLASFDKADRRRNWLRRGGVQGGSVLLLSLGVGITNLRAGCHTYPPLQTFTGRIFAPEKTPKPMPIAIIGAAKEKLMAKKEEETMISLVSPYIE
ncbi:hypothetical protein K1719_016340 [Acacia pycnantha]|nr:hypothetical protein K1719_016340 [Acacia pycnantha]